MRNDYKHYIDTSGSILENDLMDLFDGALDISQVTIIGSSDDEIDPFFDAYFANVRENFLPTTNTKSVANYHRQQEVLRPVSNPPTIRSGVNAFPAVMSIAQITQEPVPRSFPRENYLPLPVPFYPNNRKNIGYNQAEYGVQMPVGQ